MNRLIQCSVPYTTTGVSRSILPSSTNFMTDAAPNTLLTDAIALPVLVPDCQSEGAAACAPFHIG